MKIIQILLPKAELKDFIQKQKNEIKTPKQKMIIIARMKAAMDGADYVKLIFFTRKLYTPQVFSQLSPY